MFEIAFFSCLKSRFRYKNTGFGVWGKCAGGSGGVPILTFGVEFSCRGLRFWRFGSRFGNAATGGRAFGVTFGGAHTRHPVGGLRSGRCPGGTLCPLRQDLGPVDACVWQNIAGKPREHVVPAHPHLIQGVRSRRPTHRFHPLADRDQI